MLGILSEFKLLQSSQLFRINPATYLNCNFKIKIDVKHVN